MKDISEAFDKALDMYMKRTLENYDMMQKRATVYPLFASMLLKNILWYFVEYNEFSDDGINMILDKTSKEFEIVYKNME